MTKKATLIPCPVTEDEKHTQLSRLMTDMKAILQARWSLSYTPDNVDYSAALDEYMKAALYVAAREFVTIYDLAPIDH